MRYRLYCDGGARGNPGPAAAACVILRASGPAAWQEVATLSRYLGKATNNQAEYQAVLLGLGHLAQLGGKLKPSSIDCHLDSELVTRQLTGHYRVKHQDLKPLFWQVRELVVQLGNVQFLHVRRSSNQLADRLVNQALDQHR